MTISMEKVTIDPLDISRCGICFDDIQKNDLTLGHKIPENRDEKIYCYIHENCLKHHIFQTMSLKCPGCRRTIIASTVVLFNDLDDRIIKTIQRRYLFESIGMTICAFFATFAADKIDDNGLIFSIMGLAIIGTIVPLANMLLFEKSQPIDDRQSIVDISKQDIELKEYPPKVPQNVLSLLQKEKHPLFVDKTVVCASSTFRGLLYFTMMLVQKKLNPEQAVNYPIFIGITYPLAYCERMWLKKRKVNEDLSDLFSAG